MKFWLFVVVVLLVMSGCATRASLGRVSATYDKFKHQSVETVQVGERAFLSRLSRGAGPATYALVMDIYSSGNRAAWPDEVVFLIDGQSVSLRGESDLRDVGVSSYSVSYHERGIYPIQPTQIRQIIDGKDVQVRIYGRNRSFEAMSVDTLNQQAFLKFYDLFVRREWDSLTDEERRVASNPITAVSESAIRH